MQYIQQHFIAIWHMALKKQGWLAKLDLSANGLRQAVIAAISSTAFVLLGNLMLSRMLEKLILQFPDIQESMQTSELVEIPLHVFVIVGSITQIFTWVVCLAYLVSTARFAYRRAISLLEQKNMDTSKFADPSNLIIVSYSWLTVLQNWMMLAMLSVCYLLSPILILPLGTVTMGAIIWLSFGVLRRTFQRNGFGTFMLMLALFGINLIIGGIISNMLYGLFGIEVG